MNVVLNMALPKRSFKWHRIFLNTILSAMQNEPLCKKPTLEKSTMKIGTHNGSFHCDEALACYMLKCLPKYASAEIVRTRDPSKLSECDIVVDVGGEYEVSRNRFDHHQRSFKETMNSLRPEKKWKTKLSSAGLVYCHFGEEIIRSMMDDVNENILRIIYDMVYENFVEEIDAIDNGVDQFEGEARYKITTNLSARVGRLNPDWNDDQPDENVQFQKAMSLVGSEFTGKVKGYLNVWLPARVIVERSLKTRDEVDNSNEIIKLERFCPWKEHLFQLEEEKGIVGEVKYVLYQDQSQKWRIQCVGAGRNTFENRLSLPSQWRGIRDQELSDLSGIPGCIFVHASGFIGGNSTYAGVLAMARAALKQSRE